MNKIMTGTLGVLATGVVVTTAAYAAFTSQATISGINFGTGTTELQVSATSDGTFGPSLIANLDIDNVFPGFGMEDDQMTTFYVKNNSDVGSPDMKVTAKLTSAGGWGSGLENYVELAVIDDDAVLTEADYHSLTEWNTSDPAMTIIQALAAGQTDALEAYVRLLDTAPDSVSGVSLTDITFTLTGTTVAPTP